MNIKKAKIEDIDVVMNVIDAAKRFMRQTGNDKQWTDGYPSKEFILNHIRNKNFYKIISDNEQIVGVFYFKVENDKTYTKIYEGEWLNNEPYGVVHCIASNGKQKGIAAFCLQWCLNQCKNVRIDTHRDNSVMLNILKNNGFQQCGIIFIANGTERIAFQKCL
jgi:RimJ/RimL family protein N-acetyltransferase